MALTLHSKKNDLCKVGNIKGLKSKHYQHTTNTKMRILSILNSTDNPSTTENIKQIGKRRVSEERSRMTIQMKLKLLGL